MARTRERKLEVARRIRDIACDEYGLAPHQLLFDDLTFTLATGDAEWIDSAVETIEGIRLIKRELPGVLTSLGVSNVSFGLTPPARAVLNSVFLYHCVEAGLDAAIINPAHDRPLRRDRRGERASSPRTSSSTAAADALARYIEHFSGVTERVGRREGRPFAGLAAPERIHAQILHRRKEGIEALIDEALRDRDRGHRAQRGPAPGDEGRRRPLRSGRADPALRPAERRGDEARRRPPRAVPGPGRGVHQGPGGAGHRLRRCPRHRQEPGQDDPQQQRLHGPRPGQAGPAQRPSSRRRSRSMRTSIGLSRAAGLDQQADADDGRGAGPARPRLPRDHRRCRHQPGIRPAHPLPRSGAGVRARASSTARTPSRGWRPATS